MPRRHVRPALLALVGMLLVSVCPAATSVALPWPSSSTPQSCPIEARESRCCQESCPRAPQAPTQSPCAAPCRSAVNPGTEAEKARKIQPDAQVAALVLPDAEPVQDHRPATPRPAIAASPPLFLLVAVFRT